MKLLVISLAVITLSACQPIRCTDNDPVTAPCSSASPVAGPHENSINTEARDEK